MAGSALRGTGFRLLGCRGIRPDGSYIGTEFFCILYVPLVPTRTLRVTPAPGQSRLPFVHKRFLKGIKQPLDWSQVVSVYLSAIAFAGYGLSFFAFAVTYLKRHSNWIDDGWVEILIFLVWMSLPMYLIASARDRALKRSREDVRKINTPKPIN